MPAPRSQTPAALPRLTEALNGCRRRSCRPPAAVTCSGSPPAGERCRRLTDGGGKVAAATRPLYGPDRSYVSRSASRASRRRISSTIEQGERPPAIMIRQPEARFHPDAPGRRRTGRPRDLRHTQPGQARAIRGADAVRPVLDAGAALKNHRLARCSIVPQITSRSVAAWQRGGIDGVAAWRRGMKIVRRLLPAVRGVADGAPARRTKVKRACTGSRR